MGSIIRWVSGGERIISGGHEEACSGSEMLDHWKYNGQHQFLAHSLANVLQQWRKVDPTRGIDNENSWLYSIDQKPCPSQPDGRGQRLRNPGRSSARLGLNVQLQKAGTTGKAQPHETELRLPPCCHRHSA